MPGQWQWEFVQFRIARAGTSRALSALSRPTLARLCHIRRCCSCTATLLSAPQRLIAFQLSNLLVLFCVHHMDCRHFPSPSARSRFAAARSHPPSSTAVSFPSTHSRLMKLENGRLVECFDIHPTVTASPHSSLPPTLLILRVQRADISSSLPHRVPLRPSVRVCVCVCVCVCMRVRCSVLRLAAGGCAGCGARHAGAGAVPRAAVLDRGVGGRVAHQPAAPPPPRRALGPRASASRRRCSAASACCTRTEPRSRSRSPR